MSAPLSQNPGCYRGNCLNGLPQEGMKTVSLKDSHC